MIFWQKRFVVTFKYRMNEQGRPRTNNQLGERPYVLPSDND